MCITLYAVDFAWKWMILEKGPVICFGQLSTLELAVIDLCNVLASKEKKGVPLLFQIP